MSRVNIRPGVSVLSVLRHLNYKPWYALAEFVDNAVQSFTDRADELFAVDSNAHLKVEIEAYPDSDRIVIRDNAAGIPRAEYDRAFKTAAPPKKKTGLSEFGMGMKSAACWFAPIWSVRSSSLGEPIEGLVEFDVAKITSESLEDVIVQERIAPVQAHFTEVTLKSVYKMPQGRTQTKIREHLGSIYRTFLRSGAAEIIFNGTRITYEEPRILVAPYYRAPDTEPREWRVPIDISLPGDHRLHGFAALREKGSTSHAGFALFRRGRVIEGSGDEGYRPESLFGKSNSFTFQRLFGELHLEGFGVSHTKDGIQWEELEEPAIAALRAALSSPECPILEQAEGHRVRPSRADISTRVSQIVERAATVLEGPHGDTPLSGQFNAADHETPATLPPAAILGSRTLLLPFDHYVWKIDIEVTDDAAVGDLIQCASYDPNPRHPDYDKALAVRVSAVHPFSLRFCGPTYAELEPTVRLAVAMCIAEWAARSAGVTGASAIREYVNELARTVLHKE